VLEAEKEELRVMVEAVTEEIAEEEMATSVACRDKNEAAVERAHTRIVELEQQLQGKKAFAESLRSEVANTDAHLVTCSQTVEMLEAKVREMEGAHPNIIHSR
jgi:chromosome segregation ATPase